MAFVNDATLSLVLPVRDAAATLQAVVMECLAVAPCYFTDCEIIIVDDGSRDATPTIMNNLAAMHDPVMVIHHEHAHGFGRALRDGWSAARGDYVLFLDVGGAVAPGEMARLLPYLESFDVVMGSRMHADKSLETRLINFIFDLDIRDVGCHFGLLRTNALDCLQIEASSALILAELYAKAKRQGVTLVQVGVQSDVSRTTNASHAFTIYSSPGALWDGFNLWLRRRQSPDLETRADRRRPRWRQLAAAGAGTVAIAGGVWLLRRRSLPRS